MISFAIWGIVLLHFTGVLPELWAELDAMADPARQQARLGVRAPEGRRRADPDDRRGCLWLSGLVEQRLQQAAQLDSNVRVVISKFVRALLLAVGVLFALQAVGIDLTLLTVFGGALGVGIGLGLQKLASNYIAGFTILLDRSIRLGDMITVDNRFGIVAKRDVALRHRAQPRRRRGGRAERDAGDDDGAQPLVHESRESGVGAARAGELRQRHRARAEADGGGGAAPSRAC